MLSEILAMYGMQDNKGLVRELQFIEKGEEFAERKIRVIDTGIVPRDNVLGIPLSQIEQRGKVNVILAFVDA